MHSVFVSHPRSQTEQYHTVSEGRSNPCLLQPQGEILCWQHITQFFTPRKVISTGEFTGKWAHECTRSHEQGLGWGSHSKRCSASFHVSLGVQYSHFGTPRDWHVSRWVSPWQKTKDYTAIGKINAAQT